MTCQRCFRPTTSHIMSMLNTQEICMDCKDAEILRPDYRDAEIRDLRSYAQRLHAQGMSGQAKNVEDLAKQLERENT